MNQAMMVVLRPSGRIPALGERLRQTARSIGPRVLIERIRTANDWFDDRVITPRCRTVLLGLLGGLGLVLALVGVFGMTAYAVSRRTAEIGLRMAVGARPDQVVKTIVRDSAVPIVIGTALGLLVDFLTARDQDRHLTQAAARLSEEAFRAVWDNSDDAEYDRL